VRERERERERERQRERASGHCHWAQDTRDHFANSREAAALAARYILVCMAGRLAALAT